MTASAFSCSSSSENSLSLTILICSLETVTAKTNGGRGTHSMNFWCWREWCLGFHETQLFAKAGKKDGVLRSLWPRLSGLGSSASPRRASFSVAYGYTADTMQPQQCSFRAQMTHALTASTILRTRMHHRVPRVTAASSFSSAGGSLRAPGWRSRYHGFTGGTPSQTSLRWLLTDMRIHWWSPRSSNGGRARLGRLAPLYQAGPGLPSAPGICR